MDRGLGELDGARPVATGEACPWPFPVPRGCDGIAGAASGVGERGEARPLEWSGRVHPLFVNWMYSAP